MGFASALFIVAGIYVGLLGITAGVTSAISYSTSEDEYDYFKDGQEGQDSSYEQNELTDPNRFPPSDSQQYGVEK